MSDKIIALVGESGSGKTTIAELLEKEGYNYIHSYTTRKPRFEGERGHIFVDEASCFNYKVAHLESGDYPVVNLKRNVIAYAEFDNEHYWATKEQYQNKGTSIYIIDPVGIKELRERVTDAEIVVIYLNTDSKIRMDRLFERYVEDNKDKFQSNELYARAESMARTRLNHDREAFKVVECNYCIDANGSIGEVLERVRDIININLEVKI